MVDFIADYDADGFEHISDPEGIVWAAFEITAQPSYVFLSTDGSISRQIGSLDATAFDAVLQHLVDT